MSGVKYEIGDIIQVVGIVHELEDGRHPVIRTDFSNRTVTKIGRVEIGDFVKRGDSVLKVTKAFGSYNGWIPATKEEYDEYIKKQELDKIKDVRTETLMAEIVRRHREPSTRNATSTAETK